MKFCEKCNYLTADARCPACGNKKLRDVYDEDFCYFVSLSSFNFEMFAYTLQENDVEVVGVPFYVGGVTHASAGRAEGRRVYIRYKDISTAKELYDVVFGPEEG